MLTGEGDPEAWCSHPPLVLDLALLLSPWGLWLTRRLSLATEIWLPRGFVPLIAEGGEAGELKAGQLAAVLGLADPAIVIERLARWRRAWPEVALARGIYWLGDALDASGPRRGLTPGVLGRLDALIEGLDGSLAEAEPDPFARGLLDPLLEAGRDALALTASLTADGALLLSACLPGTAQPAAVTALDHYRIPHHRIADGRSRDAMVAGVLPALRRAQVLPLFASGALHAAVIHLIVPSVSGFEPEASPVSPTDELDEPTVESLLWQAADSANLEQWEHAMALWHDELC